MRNPGNIAEHHGQVYGLILPPLPPWEIPAGGYQCLMSKRYNGAILSVTLPPFLRSKTLIFCAAKGILPYCIL